MCGVVAIYAYGPQASAVDPTEIVAVRDHMASRGPDGKGLWLSTDGRVGFGHRRLAIIGLGEQGAQPMVLERRCRQATDDDTPLVLTYNGEIYNHVALRRALEARGHVFRTGCDTEVILHLYEEHGDRLVQHLRGMFAFALWDGLQQRLLLARDPYGIKPLYYRDDGAQLRVASQVRPLVAAARPRSATPDDAALAAFLLFGNIPEPLTMWQEVREVPAGSSVIVDARGVHEPLTFFSLNDVLREALDGPVPDDRANHLRTALKDSVSAHLVADVEVGVFLSSGVDSAVLLGLAAAKRGTMHAVTLGFAEYEGTPSDEVPLAQETARLYGAEHAVATVSETDFRMCWPTIRDSMDQPSIDGVNTWLVSRAAADAGLKVVLSGLGGDEMFAGYPSFTQVPRWGRLLRAPATIPGLGHFTRRVLQGAFARGATPKTAGALEFGRSIERLWLLWRGVFMPWELPALMGRERARDALDQLDLDARLGAAILPDPGGSVGKIAALESSLYMRNQLLRDADWASMAHSLEIRLPLVDARLLPQAAPILFSERRSGDAKRLFAIAPRPRVLAPVVAHKKTGFSVPLGQWLTRLHDHDSWRRVPLLSGASCPWGRRWAYIVADSFGLLAQ
jgi:asparagine synthase (glutamine-hydrolysing)